MSSLANGEIRRQRRRGQTCLFGGSPAFSITRPFGHTSRHNSSSRGSPDFLPGHKTGTKRNQARRRLILAAAVAWKGASCPGPCSEALRPSVVGISREVRGGCPSPGTLAAIVGGRSTRKKSGPNAVGGLVRANNLTHALNAGKNTLARFLEVLGCLVIMYPASR